MPNTATSRPLWCAALAALACAATPTFAQGHAHGPAPSIATSAAPAMTDAQVRRIDKEAGKITLRHGEIKHLDMPPMTMVFTVRDKTLLDKTRVGANVLVQVTSENGQMLVTDLQPVP